MSSFVFTWQASCQNRWGFFLFDTRTFCFCINVYNVKSTFLLSILLSFLNQLFPLMLANPWHTHKLVSHQLGLHAKHLQIPPSRFFKRINGWKSMMLSQVKYIPFNITIQLSHPHLLLPRSHLVFVTDDHKSEVG